MIRLVGGEHFRLQLLSLPLHSGGLCPLCGPAAGPVFLLCGPAAGVSYRREMEQIWHGWPL